VIIGNQIWMTKNLNVDQFQNGDKISQAKTFEEWNSLAQKGEAAWCYFNFNENNAQEFGKIYNWFAIIDKRLLAPKGWHIPSLSEWNSFSYQIGGCFSENSDSLYLCLSKIKKQGAWNDSKFRSPSTNESGFSAIPCGKINVSKSGGNLIYNFENNRDLVFWWSSTWSQEYSEVINNSVKYDLNSSANIIRLGENFSKGWSYISEGMYVRCVKD
jgi:uncharacterized protein (TIGR02145 family)